MTETTIEKHRAVIAVAAITPPRGKSRSYTLHTHDGNEFSLWPDKIGLIRTDEQYDVEYSAKAADNGRTYYNIVGTPKNVGPYQPATTPLMNGKAKKMENNYYKPRDPAEQKQIWVCALLAREIEKSPVLMSCEELRERARIHAEVWDEVFGDDAEWMQNPKDIARE